MQDNHINYGWKILRRNVFKENKLIDWKSRRMQDNMMAINTTLSSFLNIEHTREIRERKENILHQSIISQAYIFISFKILVWKSNSSKHFLSHIDQIFDILLEWAYCVQLLFERALSCTTNTLLNYWVFLLGFWYKS